MPSSTPIASASPGAYGNNAGGVQSSPSASTPPGIQYYWPDGKGGKIQLNTQQYMQQATTDLSKQKQLYDLMVKARVLKSGQTKTDSIVNEWAKVGLEASRNGMDAITYLEQRAKTFGGAGSKTTTGKYAVDLQGNKIPTTQLQNQWLAIGPDNQNQFIEATTQLGKKPSQASTVWAEAVKTSSSYLDKGIYMSPLQVIQKEISDRTSQPITYTNTDQTTYDPTAQTPGINQAYINLIGRAANSDEINSIISQANAQKQVSKTTYIPGGINRQTTEIQSPSQIAQSQLLTSPQYGTERKGMQDLGFLSWLNNSISGGISNAGGQANG